MFCKFCGEPINRDTMECKHCGKPAGHLTDGVGFWDLASPEKKTATSGNELTPLIKTKLDDVVKEIRSGEKRKNKVFMIALVIMGLVFVLNVVQLCLIAGVSGSQEMLSTMLHSLGEETEQGTEQGTEPVENISEPPLPGESETGEQSTESWLDVFGIEIRKPPTSSPVDLSGGMNSGIHKMLFTIEAAGEDVQNFEFHWQRYNEETGRWEDINEDNAYSVSNTIKDGVTAYSALYLERVTDNVIGEYRCLVENSKGYQIPSDSAVLSPMNAASEEGTEPTEHEKVPNGSWGGKN